MNVKCTYFTNSPVCKGRLPRGEKYNFSLNNFILNNKQVSKKSVTIYGHTPLRLHISGIRNFKELKITKELLEKMYNVKCYRIRLDNIFLSHKNYQNIDLNKIYYFVRKNYKKYYCVDYNVELSPSIYLKPKIKDYPTISLFRTASFQMMGSTCINKFLKSKKIIKMLISMFKNTNNV